MRQKLVSLVLLTIFVLDHAAMFVNAFDIGSDGTTSVESVCGCTCCGDVCPMGADCCCYVPGEAKEAIDVSIRLVENTCSPNSLEQPFPNSFFSNVKWVGSGEVSIPETNIQAASFVFGDFKARSRTVQPPTPPPIA